MRPVSILVAALSVLWSTTSRADVPGLPGQGPVLVLGQGTISCGQWVNDRTQSRLHGSETAWVLGFLTGMNAAGRGEHVGNASTTDDITLWVDNFCGQNPQSTLYEAAATLRHELQKKSN